MVKYIFIPMYVVLAVGALTAWLTEEEVIFWWSAGALFITVWGHIWVRP